MRASEGYGLPALGAEDCQVWWGARGHCTPRLQLLLDQVEIRRRERYLHAADRDRFTVGVAMSRLILAGHLKTSPAEVVIDRTCARCGEPHGRPRLAGAGGLDFSVSHSADLIVVAVVRDRPRDGAAGRAVGVDVEQVVPLREPSLPDAVLSAAERAVFDRCGADSQAAAFFRYWVRKEAVLKATGDGLTVPLTDLTVSEPDRPAQLRAWARRPLLPATVTMHDLDAAPGYAASLALIGRSAVVREWDATALLTQTCGG